MTVKTAVIGLGKSGLSTVNFLIRNGIVPDVYDTREHPAGEENLPESCRLVKGELSGELLGTYDELVVGPGLALSLPALQEAASQGVSIIGDIELFARYCQAPVVGVTGSNGKSTVVTLVSLMAEAAGLNCGLGGNIGIPALDVLAEDRDCYVLELSSFELETTSSLRLVGATILNLSEDHLDRYDGKMELYLRAKQRIFAHADRIIVNREDVATIPPNGHYFASFGGSGDSYGITLKDNEEWLSVAGTPVFPVSGLKIYGRHNQMNALAAMALADALGVSREAQNRVLSSFSGLPHRCRLVRERNGVRWYNDSKATNVGSTLAAVAGLKSGLKGRIILLAGGLGKGQDFTPIKNLLGHEVSLMLCFGRDGGMLRELGPETALFETMAEAVEYADGIVRPGDVVLLAPACASFDQFKGFEDRGDKFAAMVENLA
ncbi:UDP-N-acetylmuramoyl-L-alanine--D-glutamate ligase [Succinimonas amylolytica]|uniref:UDP-N-acetylmuramoyl-L-alanine--D-glutamate ligase n=1 Tax=Succinimonas amylolytica TaxID=83769 RepID=UPI0003795F3B|nr:UDP-N-acetylmuramoyl-L-alanine--D-glutamate ligase [Succinimonas amylolytica]